MRGRLKAKTHGFYVFLPSFEFLSVTSQAVMSHFGLGIDGEMERAWDTHSHTHTHTSFPDGFYSSIGNTSVLGSAVIKHSC